MNPSYFAPNPIGQPTRHTCAAMIAFFVAPEHPACVGRPFVHVVFHVVTSGESALSIALSIQYRREPIFIGLGIRPASTSRYIEDRERPPSFVLS